MFKYALAASAALLGLVPLAASAQAYPPSYGEQPAADEQIRGRILDFDGGYDVTIRDDRGFVDHVRLHDGTIINPTGLTLAPGMVVSLLGVNDGSVFAANEVDTPYTIDANVPSYGGHPFDYYGPSVSLDFFFGSGGWWHRNDFSGPYRDDGGARVYDNVHVTTYGRAESGGRRGGYERSGDGADADANRATYAAPANGGGAYARPVERRYATGSFAQGRSYQPQPSRGTTYGAQQNPARSKQNAGGSYRSSGGQSHGGGGRDSGSHDRR